MPIDLIERIRSGQIGKIQLQHTGGCIYYFHFQAKYFSFKPNIEMS